METYAAGRKATPAAGRAALKAILLIIDIVNEISMNVDKENTVQSTPYVLFIEQNFRSRTERIGKLFCDSIG